MSGLGGTIMQGMAFGAGSEVAHQVVRSVMGGSGGNIHQAPADQQQPQDLCTEYNLNLVKCIKQNADGISMCQDYMNMLQQCQKDNQFASQNF